MKVYMRHRLILRIIIRIHPGKLIRNRIHPSKPPYSRIIPPEAILIEVHPIIPIQLLAIIAVVVVRGYSTVPAALLLHTEGVVVQWFSPLRIGQNSISE